MTKPKCGKWPYDFTIVAGDIIRNSRGSSEAAGLISAALADAYADGRASRDGLRKALEKDVRMITSEYCSHSGLHGGDNCAAKKQIAALSADGGAGK